ncbi:MAG TPA: hypothetical protein VG873_10490 [Burkholderiales bacterium]|nr:hypothetical protein [Burkholderiales bacterium]
MSVPVAWYRDPATARFIVLRYLPWFFALNLAWEAVHVRLYTLWTEATARYITFSVVHCTFGDLLIGLSALLLALIAGRERGPSCWRLARIGLLSTLFGAGYTVWSEWMNVTILRSWMYADSMPRVPIGDFQLGLTPLLQWLLLPTLALYMARVGWVRT